jgi:hypothetical protein
VAASAFRMRPLLLALGHLWALPNTLLGLLIALPFARFARAEPGGVLHFVTRARGPLAWWLRRFHVAAFTLGAVVTHDCEAGPRDVLLLAHERAHVWQTFVLGPLFLPVYFLASGWAWARGGDAYRDNWFEVHARRAERRGRPVP